MRSFRGLGGWVAREHWGWVGRYDGRNADHRTRLCVDPPHFNNRRGAKKQMAQQHPRPQGFSGRKWKGRKKEKGLETRLAQPAMCFVIN